jgi:Flp pilus assembly protein CpaB
LFTQAFAAVIKPTEPGSRSSARRAGPKRPTTYTRLVSLTRLLWAVAVVLAVVVVGMAYRGRGGGETTSTVVVAKQLIPAGTLARPSMYELVSVPRDEVEAGTLTDLRVLAQHSVARPIFPGERFTTSDFSP